MYPSSRNHGFCSWHFVQLDVAIIFGVISGLHFGNSLEICTNGFFHPDCIPYNCTHDSECQQASPGPYSRCLRDFGQCECFHNNRPGIALNHTCLPVKTGGDVCMSHSDCASIRGQSTCLGMSTNRLGIGICGCHPKDYYHEELNECLRLQDTPEASCHVQIQCSHPGALGALSICEARTSTCKCWDTGGDGVERTGWYDGKCYYSRGVNESCDLREECVVGFHPNADCLPHESYRNETVCTCPDDETCEEDSSAAQISTSSSSSSIPMSISKVSFLIMSIIIFSSVI